MGALRILVTGSSGFLGGFVLDAVQRAGHVPLAVSRHRGDAAVDLGQPGMVDAVLEALRPDVVLHLAARSRMAECEADPEGATRVNAWLAGEFARRLAARVLCTSTDLVFDGRAAPYAAHDPPAPLSSYGHSKAEGERRVLALGGRVVRLPLLFGPDAAGRGATASLRRALEEAGRPPLYTNEYRTPLAAVDAARALVALVVEPDGPRLLHVAGPERVSRWQLGQRFVAIAGLDAARLDAVECQDPLRPRDVALVSDVKASRSLDAMLADAAAG